MRCRSPFALVLREPSTSWLPWQPRVAASAPDSSFRRRASARLQFSVVSWLLPSSPSPPLAGPAPCGRRSRAGSEACCLDSSQRTSNNQLSASKQLMRASKQLVRVISAVELVDPTGQRDGAEGETQDHQPPAEHRAEHDQDECHPAEQGPLALRREEPQVTGALEHLTIGPVLRPGIDTPSDQGEVAGDHQGQEQRQDQRDGTGGVLAEEPIDRSHNDEKDDQNSEDP